MLDRLPLLAGTAVREAASICVQDPDPQKSPRTSIEEERGRLMVTRARAECVRD